MPCFLGSHVPFQQFKAKIKNLKNNIDFPKSHNRDPHISKLFETYGPQ